MKSKRILFSKIYIYQIICCEDFLGNIFTYYIVFNISKMCIFRILIKKSFSVNQRIGTSKNKEEAGRRDKMINEI